MKIYTAIFTLFFLLISQGVLSQESGAVQGTVIDANGEGIPFAKVVVNDEIMRATRVNGEFKISLSPGTYEVRISAVRFKELVLTDVVINENDSTVLTDLVLVEDVEVLGPVTVIGDVISDSDGSMIRIKQNAPGTIDPISQESMGIAGVSSGDEAVKLIPGVSIGAGKYVYIRGLGDRYNKTLLNGMDIPGLDPDKNTIQMDLFPTAIMDNIIVYKSALADLPADFSGGVIEINLKSLPKKKKREISVSLGYNPQFHFQQDYLTYNGGSTDFLGFDDGTREIPATTNIPFFAQAIGDEEKAMRYQEVLNGFNPTMGAYERMSLMDIGFSYSTGNQFKLEKWRLGYAVVAGYKNTTEFYRDVEFGRYGLDGDASITEMQTRELQTGSYGVNNVLLNGMAGMTLQSAKVKYTFTAIHLQNGESKAGVFDYTNSDQGSAFHGYQHNLEYSQRSLTSLLFSGKYFNPVNKSDLEWKIAPTLSIIKDPDVRFTRYEERNDSLIIGTEAGFPERIWRELNEKNLSARLDYSKEFMFKERSAILKVGGRYVYKTRDFIIRNFALNVRDVNLTGNPDELFADENIWPMNGDPTKGTTYEASFLPDNPNQYSANIQNTAAYVSTELNPWRRIKTVIGVRVENFIQRYTGQDQLGLNAFNNERVLNDLGIFPSVNIAYQITDKQNLRFSYGRTTARPSFKELSYAEIYDPVTGRTFIGGLFRDEDASSGTVYWDGELKSTDIHNFDIRWEVFPKPGQTIAVTGFYKKFFDPIEIVQFSAQTGSFQPRNVGYGEVLGGELEIKKDLASFGKRFANFSFNANFTYTASRILYSLTEKESREANARNGQEIGEYRDMAGQAPYLINAGLIYNGGKQGFGKGLQGGIFYNVQGQTLQYVGIVDRPDIYSVPFHSLNINLNKQFGDEQQYLIGLKATNVLNDAKEAVFKSYQAQDQYFSRLNPGSGFRVKFRYRF